MRASRKGAIAVRVRMVVSSCPQAGIMPSRMGRSHRPPAREMAISRME